MKDEKNKVGRPKLADTKLKKNSLIVSGVMLLIVVCLVIGGLVSLNILPNKLKGEVTYKTFESGEEFCLGDECFETISDNGDTVTALAKYNLLVGYTCTEYSYDGSACTPISTDTVGYGLQNENTSAGYYATRPLGVTPFSTNVYWDINDYYGTFIYDERSLLFQYLNNYENYLHNEGFSSVTATLMNKEQVMNFSPSINVAFWAGFAVNSGSENIGGVSINYENSKYNNYLAGVRPVITINKSNIPGATIESAPPEDPGNTGNNNNDDISNSCTEFEKKETYNPGDIIAICNHETNISEDFYVISDNGTTLTALAKYNLLVGNTAVAESSGSSSITSITPIPTTASGYGIQSSTAKGIFSDLTTYVGVLKFSQTRYFDDSNGSILSQYNDNSGIPFVYDNNSSLWEPVQSYKSYLESIGATITSVTIPSVEQLEILSKIENGMSIVLLTSYWSGNRTDGGTLGAIYSNDYYGAYHDIDSYIGLRPVIVISKEDSNSNNNDTPDESTNPSVDNPTENKPNNSASSETEKSNTSTTKNSTTASNNKTTTKNKSIFNKLVPTTTSEKTTTTISKEKNIINKVVNKKDKTVCNNKCNKCWLCILFIILLILTIAYIIYDVIKDKKKKSISK